MISPLTPAQLTWGCYATAILLNVLIAGYALGIARRLGGDGVFARMARFSAGAALAFAACNGVGLLAGESTAVALVETVGASLLVVASYTLYTLVRVE